MVEVEERGLRAFEQHVGAAFERSVQQADGVGDERRHTGAELVEHGHDLVDVERVAARLLDERVLGNGAFAHERRETSRVEDVTDSQPDTPRLVGVGGADALERGADLVVAAHRLGDRVVRLMPREDQVSTARHLQLGAGDASRLERVDLLEQRRQIDDDAVGDHRDHVVVQDPRRNELQGVLLAADHHGVAGVVAALVAHHVGVLLRQQVDDLGFALIAPLGSDDDGDGHTRSPSGGWNVWRWYSVGRLPTSPDSVGRVKVMRAQVWNDMDVAARDALMRRGIDDIFDPELRRSISTLIDDVRERGDAAVCDALARFDRIDVTPDGLRVTADEFERAAVSPDVDAAIDDAIAHLRAFNEAQMERAHDWSIESEPGLTVGEKITPITSAGLFTPSGKASYPSVAYQLAVPAVVAGVSSLALVVPPVPGGSGEVDPAVLVVCRKLGIDDVFRVNGPAGIAALGFGTDTIPKVRKIVGPGSPAVTIAQVEMQRHGVATMMLLGPTESLVIADDSADPMLLAADLLIEAEHGTDSTVVLLTNSTALADAVDAELERQLAELPEVRATAARSARPAARESPRSPRHRSTRVARPERWLCARRQSRRGRPCRQRIRS